LRDHAAPCGTALIRDDLAGTLTVGLTREIDNARELLEFAGLVVDEFGFGRWRVDLEQWRTSCGEMLRTYFAQEAAAEFYRGTFVREVPGRDWRQRLRAGVKAVEDMIELLVTLRATLAGRGVASR
jgi:hypothetical protein